MLASLPLPSVLAKPRRVALQQFPTNAAGSTVVLHPRFANWLRRAGLDSAPAILALRGEVVCGHPDRHVARVQLPNGRIIFLKLEHSVGEKTRFKNWWAEPSGTTKSSRNWRRTWFSMPLYVTPIVITKTGVF